VAARNLRTGFEYIVPAVLGRAEALNAGIESHHLLRHLIADSVGIEAAYCLPDFG
jgi:hypothetical protein